MIYKKFAEVYDELMYDFPYEKISNFINERLEGKTHTLLEIACGTGNFTKIFAKKYEVNAFDISEEMLAIAQNKVKNVFFFKQDMKKFKTPKTYDAILSLCDSYNYILKEEELFLSFECVKRALNPGGIFIFDLNTKEKFESMENIYLDENEDVFYTWENYFDRGKEINHYCVNFFIKEGKDTYKRFYEEHLERAYRSDEIIKLLKEAGFNRIEVYKDYENINEIEGAKRLVFVAYKEQ